MKTFTNYAEKKAKQFLNLLQGYTKGIRITAILILLLMGVSNAWGVDRIYLKLKTWSTSDGGRYAARFYNDNDKEYWQNMYETSISNVLACDLPTDSITYNKVIFVRLNPSGTDSSNGGNNWNNKWNQSGDITFQKNKLCTANSNWDSWGGNWSTITWYITGSFNGWGTNNSTTSYTLNANTKYEFKVYSPQVGYFSNTGSMERGNHSNWDMFANVGNCTLTTDIAGTYIFTYNGDKMNVTYPEDCYLPGTFNVWAENEASSLKSGSVTLNLAANTTYTFKIHNFGATSESWHGNTGTMTRDNCTNWEMNADADCKITTDFAGNYIFTYDRNTQKLSVTYPTIYQVKYYHTPSAAADAPTATVPNGNSVLANTEVTFTAKDAKTGYTWKGWYSNNNGSGTALSANKEYTTTITTNTTIYAVYTPTSYSIAYELNSGTGTMTPTSYTITTETFNLPTPTKTGYTFEGWYENAGLTGNKITQIAQGSTGNKTFYAKWTANKYTVKFHKNGGEGEMADQGFTYGDAQTLTENAFTLENALFVGWATSEENAKNGDVAYTNGQSVSNLTTTKDDVVNLYAVWATISITACPEIIKLNDQLTLTISYKNIPENYIYRVYIRNYDQPVPNNNGEWITIPTRSGTLTHTSRSGHNFTAGENNVVVQLYNQNHTNLLLTSEANTFIAEQIGTIAVYTRKEGEGDVLYTNLQNVSASFGVSITAPTIDGYRFDRWEEISGGIVFTPNTYSSTVTVTASNGGQIRAYYKKLEPKTIYLKTIEGTTDGVKWYVKYNGTEYLMDELGCTGEYYRGEVPEGTLFHFISKDNNDTQVETKGTDLQYVEGKTLYNLVSLSAGGNKIFFKPNSNWKNDDTHKYFVARFWAGSAVIKDLIDNDGDGIYECEKPAGATEVYFCLTKAQASASSGKDWPSDEKAHTHDNVKTGFKDGKNLFTLGDDQEVGGKNDTGTWSEFADTPVNGEGEWTTFTGITYRITFNQQGATTAGTTHVDVAYHASMPEIEKLPTQTEKKFGGYYTAENGQGVMLVNAFGEWQDANGYISSTTWESEACLTLHAHWTDLTPEITDVTLNAEIFEPVDDNEKGIVTAVPTINEHNNTTLEYIVCWKLLYSNGREVEGTQEDPDKYKATVVEGEGDKVKFSIAGLAIGNYIIRASLRTGGDCNSGEEISRFDKQFSIVANRIVTVNYTCDGREIMASTKQDAHVINATSITAPNLVGYTFKEWVAGDGVIISTADKTSENIEFTAYYDGYLTATYTKDENIIYFYNTLGWQNVYVYFYSGFKIDGNEVGYWNDEKGTGSQPKTNDNDWYGGSYKGYAQMEQIAGTDIWYVNASEKSTTYLAFCKDQQDKYDFFFATEVVRRNDYNKTLPMYVPIKAAPEYKNHKNSDKTTYYNKGYWMNYPENTGYKLQIYDGTGNGAKEVASIRFPYSSNTIMPLTVSVDLEAGKTYGFKILREDNTYFSNSGTMTANSNGWSFTYGIDQNCGLKTTLAGDYTFTLKYVVPDKQDPNNYQYCVDVVYPVSVGDYRVVYTDNAKWSQTAAHGAKWYHPSYAIKKNSSTEEKTDIVSFFIAKNNNPVMKFQKCTAINGQTVTWADVANGIISTPKDKTEASVYNFIIKQPAGGESISVESVEPYTGNYYIRVDAMDGKWGNYKTDPDNRMTYSAFSESEANKFGDKFSHYATKWCEEGTNVKFTIANDYSPCISDTLIQDNGNPFNNIDEHGDLTSNSGKHAANIRFMWNRKTNKISRAYVAGSTFTDRQFLILKANKEIKNSSGGSLSNAGDNHNAHQAIFSDTQNWIYERTIQVQPGTRVKLYACYPEANVANAQYFRGTYDNNNATWNDNNSVQILGGTGASWNTIRIIYDFKTNRLMAAWIPTGEIDGKKSLEADMMILREHQEDAACITFADSDDKLLNIKTVYGVLRFNRWVLNNRKATGGHEALDVKDQKTIYERALYFISFPFNVHLSDVFGFGTYGTHWVISEYNGKRRAERGYFADNCVNEDCTNWDYIWDPSNVTLEANKGYLLSLDLDLMKHDNTSFWEHDINTVELCFPSYEHVQTIEQTDYTMSALGTEYECKINYNTNDEKPDSDRRVKDSYWRCIGVPSFANYDGSLSDGSNNVINWKSDYTWKPDDAAFPFLYEWNVSDNSLSVQNTNQYTFRSTFAYLVQNGNQIKWSAVNAKPSSPIVARQRSEEQESNYEWKITLTRGEVQEDQAFIRMTNHEDVTAEFDFGQDLSKELNYGRSDIYTLIGYERAAANSMPLSDSTTVVPLGLDIEQAGDYTIAMPEGVESVGVTLLDAETGERTNLSVGMDYTVSLNQGVCHNRLYLEISPIQQTPTDIEYTDQGTREQSVRKVLINGKLYIVCDGVVYDAQGKRL